MIHLCNCGVSAARATELCQRGLHHCPDVEHVCYPEPCCPGASRGRCKVGCPVGIGR